MRARIVCVFLASGISGCSSMPDFDAPDDGMGPTVATVIDKIQCEIAEARDDKNNQILLKGLAPFSQWSASVALTLTVNDNVGTSATGLALSYIKPLHITATSWMINASPLLYQQRTRTYVQNYTINIGQIPQHQTCASMKIRPHGFNLEGDLGLGSQIYMALHSFDGEQGGADIFQPGTPGTKSIDNFGATVMFHIYKGVAGVGPNWTLVSFKGPVGGIGYQRDDQHQIVITFAPAAFQIIPILPPFPIKPKEPPPVANLGSQTPEEKLAHQKLEEQYQADLQAYPDRVAAYKEAYKIAVKNRNAIIARNAAASEIAASDARNANQALVLSQAIRNLGPILSRP